MKLTTKQIALFLLVGMITSVGECFGSCKGPDEKTKYAFLGQYCTQKNM